MSGKWRAVFARGTTYSAGHIRDLPAVTYHDTSMDALVHLYTASAAQSMNVNLIVRLKSPTERVVFEARRINGEWKRY